MNSVKKRKFTAAALRGIVMFTSFFIISRVTHFAVKFSKVAGGDESMFSALPVFVFYITSLIGTILIFSTVANTASTFNKLAAENYLSFKRDAVLFGRDMKEILCCAEFLTEAGVVVSLVGIFSALGAFPEIGGSFFIDGLHTSGYFPFIVITPITFIILLFSKYEARRYWLLLYRRHELDKLGIPHLALRIALAVFLYPTVFPMAPLLGFMAFSFVNIFLEISELFTMLGTIAIIVGAILIFLGISYTKALSRRKKFLRCVIDIALREGYEISSISMPYGSFFKSDCRKSFTLKRGDEVYECTLISTLHRTTPLVFTSPTDAYFRHRLGTRKHHVTLNHNITFYPSGDGARVLIINPSVKYLYVTDGVSTKEMIGSDKIFGFTVYDDVNFLGALERGHIGKV